MKSLKPLGYQRLKYFYFFAAFVGLLASALSIYISIKTIIKQSKEQEQE